ncbi:hypothetical protein VP01_4959g1, partial [Puccinia sorghi]
YVWWIGDLYCWWPKGNTTLIYHNSVFLLASACNDHLFLAVCLSRPVKTVQIVFSSIWLNLDLEVVDFLIPLVKVLQSSPKINRKLKADNTFKTNISSLCLYVDIKFPFQKQPSHDQSEPDLILGLVLKTFQLIITYQKKISCLAFEVLLGFRIGCTTEEQTHCRSRETPIHLFNL